MQIEIVSRSYDLTGTEMLPAWPSQDKISHYRRLADNGLGYTFITRKVDTGVVRESIVWVPKS